MRSWSISYLTALLPLLTAAVAEAHSPAPPHIRHRRLASVVRHITDSDAAPRALAAPHNNAGHAEAKKIIKKSVKKRNTQCRPRAEPSQTSSAQEASATTAEWSNSAVTGSPTTTAAVIAVAVGGSVSPNHHTFSSADSSTEQVTSTTTAWSSATSAVAPSGVSISIGGILSITDNTCGYCDADDDNPNGSEDWLNCGITGSGWTPPLVSTGAVVVADLSASGVFSPCGAYVDKFNQYAEQYGLKGIMLASFAMQESTCNPSATGGNGEAGLMQLASENCGGAPGGNCYDVDFNIQRAAKLFSDLISSNGGNIVMAVGSYNGWRKDMTTSDATAAASQGRCAAQNNLDYLHQYFNGWLQGKNGYNIGKYFNLKNC